MGIRGWRRGLWVGFGSGAHLPDGGPHPGSAQKTRACGGLAVLCTMHFCPAWGEGAQLQPRLCV